jgi:predicted RNA binding protein YcfA (HicA-like mRNA interferase family)
MQEISGLDYRSAVAAFEEAGFWILREGVHVIMTDGQHILTIPCHDPVNALTMEGIVRDAGLSPERFRQLLSNAGKDD